VVYDLKGSGYYPYTAFYYILETGAGWKDTIGSADVILRLPYEASPRNVIMNMPIGWAETTPGGRFQGNEVRWHFEEFEPGMDQPVQNMEFALVAPAAWETVLAAHANVQRSPNDGEVWGMLGKAYKDIFLMGKGYREDAGGQELYQLSVEAYEKCLSLKPDDAQWHAGFAELLANRATWDAWMGGATPEAMRALKEIHTALELAPNDPVVREIAVNMTYMIPDGIIRDEAEKFDFPWLTQTPTALPPTSTMPPVEELTATPLPLPAATDTPPVEPTQAKTTEPTPSPAPQRSSPICGSAALLPLIVMVWFVWKRR
jgi:tetratricopeptide (TPR) repeat protein